MRLSTNSFWKVGIENTEIDSMIQEKKFEASFTEQEIELSTSSGLVRIAFMTNKVTFIPTFHEDLSGEYQCHSSSFSMNSTSVIITSG